MLKEIRDNLARLLVPPGPPSSPSSPSLPPSSPGSSSSSSLTNVTPLPPLGSSSSSSLTNVTPLPPPDSSRKTQTVRPRSIMSKKTISKRSQSSDLDDALKELDEQYKKYNLDNAAKETDEQKKILKEQEKQRHEINKLLENIKNKQKEDIDWNKINEISRKANELTKNINSRSPINLRTFTPRRDLFDDINKNKEKLTPPLSKIPAPVPKSHEPQAVAVGEEAGISIMKDELKTLEDYIGYLKKGLDNMEFLWKKALEINNEIIQTEDKKLKLNKEIREREEDLERRFKKYYPDKYYPYKK